VLRSIFDLFLWMDVTFPSSTLRWSEKPELSVRFMFYMDYSLFIIIVVLSFSLKRVLLQSASLKWECSIETSCVYLSTRRQPSKLVLSSRTRKLQGKGHVTNPRLSWLSVLLSLLTKGQTLCIFSSLAVWTLRESGSVTLSNGKLHSALRHGLYVMKLILQHF